MELSDGELFVTSQMLEESIHTDFVNSLQSVTGNDILIASQLCQWRSRDSVTEVGRIEVTLPFPFSPSPSFPPLPFLPFSFLCPSLLPFSLEIVSLKSS